MILKNIALNSDLIKGVENNKIKTVDMVKFLLALDDVKANKNVDINNLALKDLLVDNKSIEKAYIKDFKTLVIKLLENNILDHTEFFKKIVGSKNIPNIYNYDNANYIFFKEKSMLFVPNNGVIKENYNFKKNEKELVKGLESEYIENISLNYEDITKILKCSKFTAKDETRPILQCVNFKDNCITALDGYRIHRNKINSNLKYEYNVNNETLKLLKKVIKKSNTLNIKFNDELIMIDILENNELKYKIISFLKKSKFINIENFLSGFENYNKKKEIIFNAPELRKILKDSKGTIANDIKEEKYVFNAKSLGFLINKDNVIIKTKNTLIKTILLNNNIAETIEVYFNYTYMLDALNGLKGNINFKYNTPDTPMYVLQNDEINVILPIRY